MVINKMFTLKLSHSITEEELPEPSSIPKPLGPSMEWVKLHKPVCETICTHTRSIRIMFRVENTSCIIETYYDQTKPGFIIEHYIDNKFDSHEIHLFEKEIFLEYLKKYFLTADEYKQWETKLAKDIDVSKKLKKHHDSGTCVGPDRCRYCIHEQRDFEV